jgi:hypothetical protein
MRTWIFDKSKDTHVIFNSEPLFKSTGGVIWSLGKFGECKSQITADRDYRSYRHVTFASRQRLINTLKRKYPLVGAYITGLFSEYTWEVDDE